MVNDRSGNASSTAVDRLFVVKISIVKNQLSNQYRDRDLLVINIIFRMYGGPTFQWNSRAERQAFG